MSGVSFTNANGVISLGKDFHVDGIMSVQNNLEINGNLLVKNNALLPVGTIIQYAGNAAPGGWLLCQGQNVLRTEYTELFDVIGSAYGSTDSSHFNIPDFRGRVAIGQNSPSNNLADRGGSATQTLSVSQLPAHSHNASSSSEGSHLHNYKDAYFAERRGDEQPKVYGTGANTDDDNNLVWRTANNTASSTASDIPTSSAGSHSHNITVESTGGTSSFSIMPPYLVINYLIRY